MSIQTDSSARASHNLLSSLNPLSGNGHRGCHFQGCRGPPVASSINPSMFNEPPVMGTFSLYNCRCVKPSWTWRALKPWPSLALLDTMFNSLTWSGAHRQAATMAPSLQSRCHRAFPASTVTETPRRVCRLHSGVHFVPAMYFKDISQEPALKHSSNHSVEIFRKKKPFSLKLGKCC